jgi:[acyl-carrier-protein] S-malonyltransferase
MEPAQAPLDAALASVSFSPSSCPVVANVDATAHSDGFAPLLSAQLCSRVQWRRSLLALTEMGASSFLELGPGTDLSGMVRRTVPDVARANVATPYDLETLAF